MTEYLENGIILEKSTAERSCFSMKYLDESLREEYNKTLDKCRKIEGLNHPLIGVEDVLRAYFILADYFTDDSGGAEIERMLVGLRSEDLLSSALCRQITSFGGRLKYTDDLDICSTLFFGLVKDHAFLDGNKRVSLLVLLYQLTLYGYLPSSPEKEFEKLVVAVAANDLSTKYAKVWRKFKKMPDKEVKTISYLLKRMVKRKDHSYHVSATMKEFVSALSGADVVCTQDNGKMHFRREIKKQWPFKPEVLNFSIRFAGWSRSVGPKTARDVLQALKLYEQYPNYQEFLSGSEPMYQLVEQFEVPLRRLKDE